MGRIGEKLGIGRDKAITVAALALAEVFLLFIVGLYVSKIGVLVMGMYADYGGQKTSFFLFIVDVLMLFMTLDSLLALYSRRPSAWRKVVRSAWILIIVNVVSYFGSQFTASSMVAFNPILVTPMAVIIIALMALEPIRSHYVPPMEDERSLKDWLKYATILPLYTSERYRIIYDDERRE